MTIQVFERRTAVPASAAALYAWHARPGAFAILAPPWERVRMDREMPIENGNRVSIRVNVGPVPLNWIAEYRDVAPGRAFTDVQVKGPFVRWEHTHTMEPAGDDASVLIDHIEYRLPGGSAGRWLGGASVKRRLHRMFAYRHRVTLGQAPVMKELVAMRVLVTGSSGLVGAALCAQLGTAGHDVVRAVRRDPSSEGEVRWHPDEGFPDASALEGIDAVVHLAGDNIADGRWNDKKKAHIRDSRVGPTRKIAESLAALSQRPKVLVCASAIGFYGDRGDEPLTETSAPGEGFLPTVCKEWEDATAPAKDAGIRTVNLRIGVVLSPNGGALKKMLTPFKMCAGGRIGSGKQSMSWIALDDLCRVVLHALDNDDLRGPVNATAPHPVTNLEFTKTLGKALGRPTIFPMPAFMARLAFGEMADALLLSSAHVEPAALQSSGFTFNHPDLPGALSHLLGR